MNETSSTVDTTEEQRKSEYQRSDRTMQLVGIAMAVGVLGIVLYSLRFTATEAVGIAGMALGLAGASAMSGCLLGFLFGIPRTLAKQNTEAKLSRTNVTERDRTEYHVNTNLEEISDWLTKILVGVGLTELRNIPAGVEALTTKLGPVLGNTPSSGAFAVTTLLFFSVCGFLESYLWTRIFLAAQFRLADLAGLNVQVQKTQQAVQSLKEDLADQNQRDARAMALALSQLNPAPGSGSTPQTAMNDAIRTASNFIRAQIFYQAQDIRSAEWNRDKAKMELTIPIFVALIASDSEQKYHRNHGQLGYALKDKSTPDWVEAEKELNVAIKIRGDWDKGGWLWYEFNRAVCRIVQDSSFRRGQASNSTTRERILDDLRAAATVLKSYFEKEEHIAAWLQLNGITEDDLAIHVQRAAKKASVARVA